MILNLIVGGDIEHLESGQIPFILCLFQNNWRSSFLKPPAKSLLRRNRHHVELNGLCSQMIWGAENAPKGTVCIVLYSIDRPPPFPAHQSHLRPHIMNPFPPP